MEVPEIFIPEITVPEIYIPEVYDPQIVIPTLSGLQIHSPGCTYWHRDIENTGNTQLLLDDPNGVYTVCDTVFPSFYPIDYTPDNLIISEELPPVTNQPKIPETKTPKTNAQPKKKEEVIIPACPSNREQRVGDFRNEKRIERVIGHKLSVDKKECITLYEDVAFKDQFIPEIPVLVSTTIIGLVAASSPLLLNAIKPIVKQIVTKLTKKKNKVK